MYRLIRPLLFLLDPEKAHHLALNFMRIVGGSVVLQRFLRQLFLAPKHPVKAFGLNFPNPIGIAAGYDKDGIAWRGLAYLGFGHIEIGTVTPKPQEGNPRPRLFRLLEERALINRMGFPSKGAAYVARQMIGSRPAGIVLGINLGVNRDTKIENAASDYIFLMKMFAPLADYLVVNISSPNTLGLRRLQAKEALEDLLGHLVAERARLRAQLNQRVPLLVKLAPDLTDAQLDDALEVIVGKGIDGVVATNTTVSRGNLSSASARETGGLSGMPLRECSTRMVRQIHQRTGGALPIIGVGGVMSVADVKEKLEAGASLVQIYTGLVYEGPGLGKRILRGLSGF